MRVAVLALMTLLVGLLAWRFADRSSEPTHLRFSAGAETGEYYRFASALRQLADVHAPDIVIDVATSAGASENAAALEAGTADLGLIQSDTVISPSVGAIMTAFPEVLHLVATKSSGIVGLADLDGKRIALMPQGSGSNAVFMRVMEHYGYEATDFDVQNLTPSDAIAALRAGEVDMMARVIALGNGSMRDLLRDDGLRLIPLDQAKAIEMFAPALERLVIPRGALNGRPSVPQEDTEALGVKAVLVANTQVPAPVIRRLTDLILSSRNELLALDPKTALLGDADSVDALGITVHPGARSYYDADKPLFFVEYADSLALVLSLAAIALSAIWQLMRWNERRRKNRGDAYNGALARIVDELREVSDPARLDAIDAELYGMFRNVVDDIDHDRLAPESLPTFEFVWASARDLFERRRAELPERKDPVGADRSGDAVPGRGWPAPDAKVAALGREAAANKKRPARDAQF